MAVATLLERAIVFGLVLATTATAASSLRLGKPAPLTGLSSQSQRFPEDVLAQPAYQVRFDDKTISNQTAQHLLAGAAYPVEVQRGAGQVSRRFESACTQVAKTDMYLHNILTATYECSLSSLPNACFPYNDVSLQP